MKIRLLFAWYGIWVGAYWDRKSRDLYLLPIPMLGVVIHIPRRQVNLERHACRAVESIGTIAYADAHGAAKRKELRDLRDYIDSLMSHVDSGATA